MYPRGNELRIDMINDKKITKYASYQNFHITNSVTKYTLHVNGFTGTLTDALTAHNRKKFSTFDADNDDRSDSHCASVYSGGWWFAVHSCHATHLNGIYYPGGKMAVYPSSKNILPYTGVHWLSTGFNCGTDSLLFTEMKVRRKL